MEKSINMAPRCLFVPIVDGNWSEWSSWEECSRTCGQGNRTRVRTCSNPPAQHGGRACEGKTVEVIMCSIRPCPGEWRNTSSPACALGISVWLASYLSVAGNWGAWLPWSPCSETCGKGMQTRLRLCNNPPPSFEGPSCEGPDTQTQVCNERNCPGKRSGENYYFYLKRLFTQKWKCCKMKQMLLAGRSANVQPMLWVYVGTLWV